MAGFDWLFHRAKAKLTDRSPGNLWSTNRNEWCREFFLMYYMLFDGYPFGIRWTNRDPAKPYDGRPHLSGNRQCAQTEPWLFADGDIQANGIRLAIKYPERFGVARFGAIPVPIDEFRSWCDSLNFYTNGNQGLNPEVLVDALDIRDYAYIQRGRYSLVQCNTGGIFTFDEGPTKENPWGVNATYSLKGLVWQNNRYGPDHKQDIEQSVSGRGYVWWDEERDGPKPTQKEYDAARTPQALGFL